MSHKWAELDGRDVLDEAWSLPGKGRCAKKPSDDAKKMKKNDYLKDITAPIFRLDLRFEDAKYSKKKKGFRTAYYASEFSISGRAKHKKKAMVDAFCCHWTTGQCDETPDMLTNRCPRGYEKKYMSMGTDYSWSDPGRVKMVVPAASGNEEPKNLEGEALVQIKSIKYVCSKDGEELSKYMGVVHGVRITQDGNVIKEDVNLDLSVDEALKGPSGWLAGCIQVSKPASKRSKGKKK